MVIFSLFCIIFFDSSDCCVCCWLMIRFGLFLMILFGLLNIVSLNRCLFVWMMIRCVGSCCVLNVVKIRCSGWLVSLVCMLCWFISSVVMVVNCVVGLVVRWCWSCVVLLMIVVCCVMLSCVGSVRWCICLIGRVSFGWILVRCLIFLNVRVNLWCNWVGDVGCVSCGCFRWVVICLL